MDETSRAGEERVGLDVAPLDVPDEAATGGFDDDGIAADGIPDDGILEDGAPSSSDAGFVVDEEPPAPADPRQRLELEKWFGLIVAIACGIFVFVSLGPDLLLKNTTPTGGDMGAHVWGPKFLTDHLLPEFRVTGWTQDWYAGFPAYVFYMVVPSLIIVWLSVDPPLWLIPVLLVVIGGAAWFALQRIKAPWARTLVWIAVVFFTVLVLPIPYNVAFKLVTVSGLVTLPLALYAVGRAARVPFPGPPLLAMATLPFIYDRGFTILGGNGASTMAGEFAFSISLTFALPVPGGALQGHPHRHGTGRSGRCSQR